MVEERIKLRNLKLVCLITLLTVVFVSVGAVYAQTNEARVLATLSKTTPSAGETIAVSITVENQASQQFSIIRFGIHGDWMAQETDFQGPNLVNDPPTLASGGTYQGQFMVTIPSSASLGSHTYYIGVDAQDSSGNYYSWNSNEETLQVVPAGVTVTTPTASSNPNGDDGSFSTADLLFIVAIVAIVAMVVLALLVLVTLRRRNRAKYIPKSVTGPPQEEPEPEQKQPEPKNAPQDEPSSGEEFDI